MKTLTASFALATLVTLVTTNALAALVAYEPFNYTIGASTTPTTATGTPTQTTGGGFANSYQGGANTAVAGLTYTGLGVNGNALKQTGSYSGLNLSSPVSSGTIYISFLYNMAVNPGGNKVGLEMNTGGNGMFVGVTTPVTGTTGKLGINQQTGYNDAGPTQWEASTANITYGNTYFIVIKLTGTGSGWNGSIWVNPTANTISETPGTPDGTFTMPQFTISACSFVNPNGGNFLFDELRLGTTWADVVNYTIAAPSAPTGLAATPGGNSVGLSWTAAAGSPASYNVKRSATSGSGYVTVSTAGTVTGTSFTDVVAGGATYYYVVSAVNAGGESANSAEVSATPTLAAPPAPAGLTATAGDSQVALNWNSAIAATGYNVKRSTASGAETTVASVSGTSYTDTGVVNGTTYFYEISATNSVGEGASSPEVSASPVAYVSVYEPFSYSVGNLANNTTGTGTGETGNWVIPTGVPTIVSPGLSYAGLPTASNAYQHTATANQNYINLGTASQMSSGTKYISFLMKGSGNSGGDTVGVYFKGNNSTSLFAGFHAPNSADMTGFSLGSVSSTSLGGATGLGSVINISNSVVHLIVIKIDFNTSGANDTVSLWIDPPAGTNSPGVAANSSVSTFDVGTISAFGINITGGYAAKFDEFRTGQTYGSVVGAPSPTVVTAVVISTNLASTVSWSAYSTNVYQPQSSPDNSSWSDVGSQITGTTTTSIVDQANAAYYQVLEYYPVTTEVVANGGLDYDTGLTPDTAQNWNGVQSQPPVWINTDGHDAPGCMDLAVTNATDTPNGSEMQQNTLLQGNPVTPGVSYNLSFWAKQISSGVSYVQQYNVQWLGSGSVFLGQSGIVNFSGGNGTWAHITQNGLVAPAGAVTALIQIIGSTGAVTGGAGEVLIDDVSLTTASFTGGPNILVPTVQRNMSFMATVQTNGIMAGDATGTVNFKTNSVQLSMNTVAGGVAASAGATINPPYTVTAIYSGDGTYLGSTGTLTVNGTGPSGPGIITNSVSGNTLTLTWPAGQGWRLVGQTNSLSTGLKPGAWFTVPGGIDGSNSMVINRTNSTVFYRLVSP